MNPLHFLLESPLLSVRAAFADYLRQDRKAASELTNWTSLVLRRLGGTQRERLKEWLSAQAAHMEAGEQKNRVLQFGASLAGNHPYRPAELAELCGLSDHDRALPSLFGFCLMRVSRPLAEAYYLDIHSDLLSTMTTQFLKASVSVRGVQNGGSWSFAGSVGRALAHKHGWSVVPSSFEDDLGVVSCEDMVGGLGSILIKAIPNPGGECGADSSEGVVFCFHPIEGFFEARQSWHQLFQGVVVRVAAHLRAHIRSLEGEHVRQRMAAFIANPGATEEGLLRLVVATDLEEPVIDPANGAFDARTSGVGAIVGQFIPKDSDRATVTVVSRSALERSRQVARYVCRSKSISATPFSCPLGPGLPSLEYRGFADAHLDDCPLQHWPKLMGRVLISMVSTGGDAGSSLRAHKLARDFVGALAEQSLEYVAGRVYRHERRSAHAKSNILLILAAWHAEVGLAHASAAQEWADCVEPDLARLALALSTDGSTQAITCELSRQGGGDEQDAWVRFAAGNAPRVIYEELISEGSVNGLSDIFGTGDDLDVDIGRFRLFGKIQKHHEVLTTFGFMAKTIGAERERMAARHEVELTSFARAQAHGLKNALAMPLILLDRSADREMDLGRRYRDSLENSDAKPSDVAREAADTISDLGRELQHLEEQATLFFWIMDESRALQDLLVMEAQEATESFRGLLASAAIRGAHLALQRKLEKRQLGGLAGLPMDEAPRFHQEVRDRLLAFRSSASKDSEGAAEALAHLQSLLGVLGIRFESSFTGDEVPLARSSAMLADAILTEVLQNACKAAAYLRLGGAPSALIELSGGRSTGDPAWCNVVVRNSARPIDAGAVKRWQPGASIGLTTDVLRGSGGIQGLWQLDMLSRIPMSKPSKRPIVLEKPMIEVSGAEMKVVNRIRIRISGVNT